MGTSPILYQTQIPAGDDLETSDPWGAVYKFPHMQVIDEVSWALLRRPVIPARTESQQ